MSVAVTPLLERRFTLGECPVWDEREQALYFTDITARTIHRYDWSRHDLRGWTLPEECGSFGLRAAGGAIVAQRASVHLFDFASGRLTRTLCAMPDEVARPTNRLNDGKVAPDGRFWVGSIDDRPQRQPVAALYRVDADGTCARMRDGITGSNGLAWSPDGRVMYHADTSAREVSAYDYDVASGGIANRRTFHTFTEVTGFPDGAAMDAEGYYWVAGVRGGRVNRLAPDGTLERYIEVPVRFPTMPCFGGPDLRTLFITSLDRGTADDPQGGTLYTLGVDVPGLPGARFAG
ncbi:MAG: SMP-30/gluconolactonase/LRE family protein [Chloroflexota bacterium]